LVKVILIEVMAMVLGGDGATDGSHTPCTEETQKEKVVKGKSHGCGGG